MTVTSPYEQAANQLAAAIDAEFAAEGLTTEHDCLHDSLGWEGARICVYPEMDVPMAGRMIQEDITIYVKYLGLYDKQIDPEQSVDPRPVTVIAERLRRAINAAADLGTPHVWYYDLFEVTYPKDPTGNKTRFLARIVAHGQNSGIIETAG